MNETAQPSQIASATQVIKKSASINILLWIHFILGLSFLTLDAYLFGFTPIGEASLEEVDVLAITLLVIILVFSLSHLAIFYSFVTYRKSTIKLSFLVNLFVVLIAIGALVYSLIRFTPVECKCSTGPGAVLISCDCFKLDPRPAIAVVLTPLIIFNLLSLLVVWKNLKKGSPLKKVSSQD